MCDWTLHTAESRGEKCTVCTDHSGVGVGKLVVFVMFGHMHVFFGSDIGVRSQASQTVCVCQSHSLMVRQCLRFIRLYNMDHGSGVGCKTSVYSHFPPSSWRAAPKLS